MISSSAERGLRTRVTVFSGSSDAVVVALAGAAATPAAAGAAAALAVARRPGRPVRLVVGPLGRPGRSRPGRRRPCRRLRLAGRRPSPPSPEPLRRRRPPRRRRRRAPPSASSAPPSSPSASVPSVALGAVGVRRSSAGRRRVGLGSASRRRPVPSASSALGASSSAVVFFGRRLLRRSSCARLAPRTGPAAGRAARSRGRRRSAPRPVGRSSGGRPAVSLPCAASVAVLVRLAAVFFAVRFASLRRPSWPAGSPVGAAGPASAWSARRGCAAGGVRAAAAFLAAVLRVRRAGRGGRRRRRLRRRPASGRSAVCGRLRRGGLLGGGLARGPLARRRPASACRACRRPSAALLGGAAVVGSLPGLGRGLLVEHGTPMTYARRPFRATRRCVSVVLPVHRSGRKLG